MSILDEILPKKYEAKERFRPEEVAEILDVSIRTVYRLSESGDLTIIHTTDFRKLITRVELESYLAVKQLDSMSNRDKSGKISSRL